MKSRQRNGKPLGLNAVGKPFGASYDPNYRLKYKPSSAHLRWPNPTTMRFVGDPPNYNANLRCFVTEEMYEQWAQRGKRRPNPRHPVSEESATAALSWKENTRKTEFTARAPLGGSYVLAPFLHCWNVDYRGKRGRGRRQLGFAYTLDEAKAIAEIDRGYTP
jgi:hypothetical protein